MPDPLAAGTLRIDGRVDPSDPEILQRNGNDGITYFALPIRWCEAIERAEVHLLLVVPALMMSRINFGLYAYDELFRHVKITHAAQRTSLVRFLDLFAKRGVT